MSKNAFIIRDCCPACKSASGKIIYSCDFLNSPVKDYIVSFYADQGGVEFKYLQGVKFVLQECNNCGLIYQKEIPDESMSIKLYEEWIDPHIALDQHGEAKDINYYTDYARDLMVLIAHFNTVPSQLKFLDFGMGWATWAIMAMAFGCESYGTEISKSRQDHATSHGIKVITWDEIPDHRFDFINVEEVLEHIAEPLETLSYLKQSLKPEGVIKITVPNGCDIKKRLRIMDWTAPKYSRRSLNAVSPLEHINCFNRRSLIRMADSAGLETVHIPLMTQYAYSTNWYGLKPALKNILYPIYRSILRRGTHILVRKKR